MTALLDAPTLRRLAATVVKPTDDCVRQAALDAADRAEYGVGPDIAPRSVDSTVAMPFVTVRSRIRDHIQAARVQTQYVRIQRDLVARTRRTRRLDLIDMARPDQTGVMAVELYGIVTGFEPDPYENRIGRILLTTPTAVSPDRLRVIDSHLWLHARRLQPDGRPRRIHMGDMLHVAARLKTYRDADGTPRVGIGDWVAVGADLWYATHRDGEYAKHRVDRRLVTALEMFDGHAWRDPEDLEAELDRIGLPDEPLRSGGVGTGARR